MSIFTKLSKEMDSTNQQIVFLNDIDIVPAPSDLSDFIHNPIDVALNEYEPFEEINSGNCLNTDVQPHQFNIINRNGVRHMKFRKPKKVSKKLPLVNKLVDQQCVICNETFARTKLKKHIQEHTFRKKHQCSECSEEFNVLENLTLHVSLHNSDGRCLQCGKIFRRLASLEGHIKSHFKNEYFMCNQGCDEMFIHEWLLKQHINQFHLNENSRLQQEREELAQVQRHKRKRQILSCIYCGKEFAKKCLLIRHERVHNGEKPFKCLSCDCCFAQKNTLVLHSRRHSDQRLHKCSLCPQRFIQKGNLISHISKCHKYNEGEISFPCNKCSCTFKKIGTLNAHISKFHASHGLYMRSETELGFKIDDVMQQLNELHRPNSLETDLVSKELFFNLPVQSISEEVQSNEEGNGKSSENRKLSSTLSSPLKLAVHTNNGVVTHCNVMQRIDGNIRWYICLYCPKEFRRPSDLVRHIRIHTKEKPFACPATNCKKKFSVKSSLNVHINTHFKSSKEKTCHVCSQTFDNLDAFDEHCRLFHMENPIFQCFICSQLCITNGDLKHHLKCHRSSTRTKKVLEQKEDDDGIQLDIIMKEPILLTNDGKIQEIAEKTVSDQERKFECTVCLSSFKRKGHLKEHVLSHLGLKYFKCEICDKTFGKMSILKRHLLYHSNEKKFKCGICNACFVSNNQLKRHSLKHTTERNVMCPYCQKTFKSKATCRTHMLIHKGEWLKQFKEQIKAGQIQFENSTNESILDIEGTSTNESNLETTNMIHNDSLDSSMQDVQEINGSLFLTNLVQENLITDSNNQFEYFLLLPTNPEDNGNGAEMTAETEQLEQPMNFSNMHFIQLEQSSLLDDIPENSCSDNLEINYQLDPSLPSDEQTLEPQTQEINLNYDCNLVHSLPSEVVSDNMETQSNPINATGSNLNQDITTNHQTSTKSRTRKSTKSVNMCAICSKVFQKPSDLCRHIRTHTLEKPFHCNICSKQFALKSTLKNHLKTHDNVKQMFPCTVCWKSYSSRHSMVTHMLIHSNSKNHQCQYCSISFRTRGHLKIHQQVHLRESVKYGVSPSDIKTRKEKARLQPILNVINECDVEGTDGIGETIRVDRVDAGTENATLHIGDPPRGNTVHQCSCHEQFSNFNEFKIHLKTHKELFRCLDCDKVFKKASLLERHNIVHSGRKEFICEICQKSYTQKATLQAHMSLHTADGALFECSKCKKKFNFKTNLTGHERKCNMFNEQHCNATDHIIQ